MAEQKEPIQAIALAPTTFAEWFELAEHVAKSSLVPKEFIGKPDDCLVAMQMGVAVGLNPFQSLQSIAVINGRPCLWGDAMLGIVMASGLLDDISETLNEEVHTATCTVIRKGKKEAVTRAFSWDDAKRAGLAEKPGPWKSYPKRMLQLRARAWALRDAFPDVLKGLQVAEEVRDYEPEPSEPKLVGGQTLEARMADLMPREKQPVMVVGDPGQSIEQAPLYHSSDPVGGHAGATAPGQEAPPEGEGKDRFDIMVPEEPAGLAKGTPAGQDPMGSSLMAPGRRDDYDNALFRTGTLNLALEPLRARARNAVAAIEEHRVSALGRPKTIFTVGSQVFETNGITRAQMMELFKLYPRVAKKYGQEKAASVLKNEFQCEHRADLTEEQAEWYTIRLREMLE